MSSPYWQKSSNNQILAKSCLLSLGWLCPGKAGWRAEASL